MRVYLLSPYHTGSHKAWSEGYVKNSQQEITLLSMAGRFWKWRMQGGALELAQQLEQTAKEVGKADALLVTDMVNVPALLALARPWLDDVPILLYMHENQLTYPSPPGEKRDLTYGMINTLSMACADRVVFNSQYHLTSFFDELPRLLKHFPDYNHLELIPDLLAKSQVLPVGLDLARLHNYQPIEKPANAPLRILWNQRWEYDKNPREFFDALYGLDAQNLPFEVIVAGENFRQRPQEFEEAESRLGRRLIHFGFAESLEEYARLLWQADVVLSTAHHEFFGISILEALYCGCYPLLPRRLSYPELLPVPYHAAHLYQNDDDLATKLRWAAGNTGAVRATNLRQVVLAYGWQTMAPVYDRVFAEMVAAKR
ncbi:MAG: DUF3524 domain-containing protein [Chloroflexi bacterium]|nr:DUF3524 domain-containing protein [Chloroflexota bacterium]